MGAAPVIMDIITVIIKNVRTIYASEERNIKTQSHPTPANNEYKST
jgi:hypothetical protein